MKQRQALGKHTLSLAVPLFLAQWALWPQNPMPTEFSFWFLSLLQNSDISVLQICQYFSAAMKSAAVSTTVRNRAFMCVQQSQTRLFPTTSKTTSIMPLVHTNICPSWKLFFSSSAITFVIFPWEKKSVTAENAYQKLKIKHMIEKI